MGTINISTQIIIALITVVCVVILVYILLRQKTKKPKHSFRLEDPVDDTDPITAAVVELTLDTTGAPSIDLAKNPITGKVHYRRKSRARHDKFIEPVTRQKLGPDPTVAANVAKAKITDENVLLGKIPIPDPVAPTEQQWAAAVKEKNLHWLHTMTTTTMDPVLASAAARLGTTLAKGTLQWEFATLACDYAEFLDNNPYLAQFTSMLRHTSRSDSLPFPLTFTLPSTAIRVLVADLACAKSEHELAAEYLDRAVSTSVLRTRKLAEVIHLKQTPPDPEVFLTSYTDGQLKEAAILLATIAAKQAGDEKLENKWETYI